MINLAMLFTSVLFLSLNLDKKMAAAWYDAYIVLVLIF